MDRIEYLSFIPSSQKMALCLLVCALGGASLVSVTDCHKITNQISMHCFRDLYNMASCLQQGAAIVVEGWDQRPKRGGGGELTQPLILIEIGRFGCFPANCVEWKSCIKGWMGFHLILDLDCECNFWFGAWNAILAVQILHWIMWGEIWRLIVWSWFKLGAVINHISAPKISFLL